MDNLFINLRVDAGVFTVADSALGQFPDGKRRLRERGGVRWGWGVASDE